MPKTNIAEKRSSNAPEQPATVVGVRKRLSEFVLSPAHIARSAGNGHNATSLAAQTMMSLQEAIHGLEALRSSVPQDDPNHATLTEMIETLC
jgi:hypothetical protein